MPLRLAPALLSGVISAVIFLAIASSGLGFPVLFLPTLPLLAVGLSHTAKTALVSAFTACLIITAIGGAAAGIFYVLVFALPAVYFVEKALLVRPHTAPPEWYPVGRIMTSLTLFACAFIALMAAYYSTQEVMLHEIAANYIKTALSELGGEYEEAAATLSGPLSFLIFSISIWLWGLTLYAHAWLAQKLVTRKRAAIRPTLAIEPFAMPDWMLFLLGISALGSVIGSEAMQFLAKSIFLTLGLPYFFAGASWMHNAVKDLPNRRFILFFAYSLVFLQFWPALVLSAAGLWQHIKALSGAKSSSRS